MNDREKNRFEMSPDQKRRTLNNLISSYESLVRQESIALQNGDDRHLQACLDASKKVLTKINRIMPLKNQLQEKVSAPKPAAPEATTSAIALDVTQTKPVSPVAVEAVTSQSSDPLQEEAEAYTQLLQSRSGRMSSLQRADLFAQHAARFSLHGRSVAC